MTLFDVPTLYPRAIFHSVNPPTQEDPARDKPVAGDSAKHNVTFINELEGEWNVTYTAACTPPGLIRYRLGGDWRKLCTAMGVRVGKGTVSNNLNALFML